MVSPHPDSSIPDQEIDLREYIVLFWSQRWILIASMLVFAAAAGFYSFRLPPEFISTSKFITKTALGGGNSELAGLAKLGGFNLPSKEDQDPLSHIDEIANNVDFLETVLQRKWPFGKDSLRLAEIWKTEPDTTEADWQYKYKMQQINRLRKQVFSFSETGGLRVLSTRAETPELAFHLNTYMLNMLNEYMSLNVRSKAKENLQFVEERIKDISNELTRSENALNEFQRSNLNLTSPSVALQYRRLNRNVSINEEIFLQLKKEYEMARIQEKKDQPLVIAIKRPEVPLARSKPNRKAILLAGAFFGLIAGLIVATIRLLIRKT